MQSRELTVRLKSYGGLWDVCGVDRARGVYPENFVAQANLWGSDSASFDLKRDPGVAWPDLRAYTQVEVEIGGTVVWAGRVKETPTRDGSERVINVQCEGWQYHLDDDAYQKTYVHTSLTDFKDIRSFLSMDLTHCPQGATVSNDNGSIVLSFPNGAVLPGNGSWVGVQLDLGPGQLFGAMTVEYETSNNVANFQWFMAGNTDESPFVHSAFTAGNQVINAAASGTITGAVSTPSRWVLLLLNYPGVAGTVGADVWVKFKAVRVYGIPAYQTSHASVLKASTVVSEAAGVNAPMLSPDLSGVQATTFSIPDFTMDGPKTPRETISAVNAYHDWLAKVDINRRLIFKEKPRFPDLEVGPWSAMEIQDASANSGDDIYNKVIVTGQSPAGQPIRVTRTSTVGTLPQRQGFSRTKILPVDAPLPTDLTAANQIGDVYLSGHQTTPFKGTVTLTGGVRNIHAGTDTPLETLLVRTGDLLRFSDRADPDTGGWGRDGRIAAVSYDHAKNQATVTIDNSRASFEALLSRFSVTASAGG